jgi:hypothetical protein
MTNDSTKVARIGRQTPAAERLPPSIWREQLKRLGYWVLMGIFGMLWMAFLVACAAYAN